MKIMIVDDAADIVQVLNFVLKKAGHDVLVASSAQEALGLVPQSGVDVLFVDYHLPDMEGPQLLGALNQKCAKNILALLISGKADEFDDARLKQWGFAAALAKPFNAAQVLAALAQITKQ